MTWEKADSNSITKKIDSNPAGSFPSTSGSLSPRSRIILAYHSSETLYLFYFFLQVFLFLFLSLSLLIHNTSKTSKSTQENSYSILVMRFSPKEGEKEEKE
jgi:hypothetical protein